MDDNSRGSSNSMRGLVSGAPAQQLPVGGVLEPKTTAGQATAGQALH